MEMILSVSAKHVYLVIVMKRHGKIIPNYMMLGKKIMEKLKGFPLAAKLVGRLLRSKLTLDHWVSVLESREWEQTSSDNDIMPALKLSYEYLPFHLQQCFHILLCFLKIMNLTVKS